MPRTKFQKSVFGLMMALVMVYGMEVYNAILRNKGLRSADFLIPIGELIALVVIVIVLQSRIAHSLARNLAFRLVDPETATPMMISLVTATMTVCCMCPMMSLVATAMFKGVDSEFFAKWLQSVALNFPMALGWQILIAGPLLRFLFGKFVTPASVPSEE